MSQGGAWSEITLCKFVSNVSEYWVTPARAARRSRESRGIRGKDAPRARVLAASLGGGQRT
eukprot:1270822-Prymnesium_polylepis.2